MLNAMDSLPLRCAPAGNDTGGSLCRRHRLQLLQHVVHLRQREFRVLGLTGFAERIEFLRDGADFGLEGFGRIGEGEGVEAPDFM